MTILKTATNFGNEKSGQPLCELENGSNQDKRNPKIKEYWRMLFGKDKVLSEKELVMRILKYHKKEPTAENMTIALNKIFRDCYRQYLDERGNHHYSIKVGIDPDADFV